MALVHPDAFLEKLLALPKGQRHLLGIAGPPCAGKSTLVEGLCDAINAKHPGRAAILAMDGFHYDDIVLNARGLRARKGAPDTYDVGGLAAMLTRLRKNAEDEIAVPVFDRDIEIARAGAAMIHREVEIILAEGNYLLLSRPPWDGLAQMFDLTALIRVGEAELRARLVERWRGFGYDQARMKTKIEGNDLPNGLIVERESRAADVELDGARRLTQS